MPRRMGDHGVTDSSTAYDQLLDLLHANAAAFRLIDHPPEGRTELVSRFRGHSAAEAAKCIVVLAKLGRKVTRYVLAVVPGDARVDLGALKSLLGATYVGFADQRIAEELGKTPSGTILPFSLDDRLEVVVDEALLTHPEIFFNAARFDRSVALRTADYLRIARPRQAHIAARQADAPTERP